MDVIAVLTGSKNPRKYWSVMKTRLKKDGTGFYRQWNEASSVFTAPWSVKPEHREKTVLDVLKHNSDKPAFFVYAFKEKHLRTKENLQKAYDLLPDDVKQSPYGVYLRRYL